MLACRYCRGKHFKCDKQLPRCSRCDQAGVECVRNGKSHSPVHASADFTKTQVWLPLPPRIDFVFEDGATGQASTKLAETSRRGQVNLRRSSAGTSASQTLSISLPNCLDAAPPSGDNSERDSAVVPTRNIFSFPDTAEKPHRATVIPSLAKSEQEAFLLRHFIDHVSSFFDVGDAYRHFAFEVPQRARTNPILLNAMLALSAKHLSRTSTFDARISDSYLETCLQSLIPALNDSDAVGDDAIFAAVILLRFLEEMNIPLLGSDPQDHRLGTQAIIAASQFISLTPIHGLRRACYWAAFRQEFSCSMLTCKPIQWKVPESIGNLEPADDFTWALRAVEQCGRVLEHIFSEQKLLNTSSYATLMEEIECWQKYRPVSFDPMFVSEKSVVGRSIACIYLQGECHVNGHQYNVLAHCLLASHMPIRSLGPTRRTETAQIDDMVREDVRKLCGVSIGHHEAPCAALMACYAIELFGDRFGDTQQRQELLDLLAATETKHGWPTSHVRVQLEESWLLKS